MGLGDGHADQRGQKHRRGMDEMHDDPRATAKISSPDDGELFSQPQDGVEDEGQTADEGADEQNNDERYAVIVGLCVFCGGCLDHRLS